MKMKTGHYLWFLRKRELHNSAPLTLRATLLSSLVLWASTMSTRLVALDYLERSSQERDPFFDPQKKESLNGFSSISANAFTFPSQKVSQETQHVLTHLS